MADSRKASDKRRERLNDVDTKRKAVLARYKDLQAISQERRGKLEQAKQLQLFQRDADGLEAWVAEKTRIASDESYKDRRNLQVNDCAHDSCETINTESTNLNFRVRFRSIKHLKQRLQPTTTPLLN